jgi:PAS domain S-box-containing protein
MAQFVWTGDNHGNLNYFNQAVYDYSGLTYEQVQKDGWIEIIHPADRKENIQKWNHSIQTGEDFIFNHRFRNKKGDYRWQLSRAVPQKDAEGKIQLWVGTSTDIHDHKLFEEQLQAAVKERTAELEKKNIELEQFAYVSSHDLQEPLRKINMFSQRIMDSEYEQLSDTSKTYFNKITESVMRMSTSLKDLLNFNSLDKEAHYEQVDLNEVLSGILKDLELLIYQKRAVIYSDQLPVIRAIPMQMHQLFYNLVNNALKFATEGVDPVIAINISIATPEQISENKLNSDKQYFQINIKDNGIGFEQAYAEKIFEMFQRLHSKHSFSGTGIGLALCKKVVLNHEGLIKATSSPGEGATFQIILPKD